MLCVGRETRIGCRFFRRIVCPLSAYLLPFSMTTPLAQSGFLACAARIRLPLRISFGVPPAPCHALSARCYASTSTSTPSTATYRAEAASTRGSGRRSFLTALACGVAGYGLALVAPPSIYKLLFPAPVLLNPTADSPAGIAAAKAIEEDLQALPIVKLLREELLDTEPAQTSPNTTSLSSEQVSRPRKWTESRPFSRIPKDQLRHSLTQSSLRGPGMFAVPAILFSTSDDKESIAVIHAGDALCGHNGIIHGGLLATILDEALARPVGNIFISSSKSFLMK